MTERDEEKEKELTDEEFDEAVFMGDNRKSLKDLSAEEAAEEVRYAINMVLHARSHARLQSRMSFRF